MVYYQILHLKFLIRCTCPLFLWWRVAAQGFFLTHNTPGRPKYRRSVFFSDKRLNSYNSSYNIGPQPISRIKFLSQINVFVPISFANIILNTIKLLFASLRFTRYAYYIIDYILLGAGQKCGSWLAPRREREPPQTVILMKNTEYSQ